LSWRNTSRPVCVRAATDAINCLGEQNLDIIALDDAVERLTANNELQGLLVSVRLLAGLSVPEGADSVDVSVATVEAE
jgi:hypothetical protein